MTQKFFTNSRCATYHESFFYSNYAAVTCSEFAGWYNSSGYSRQAKRRDCELPRPRGVFDETVFKSTREIRPGASFQGVSNVSTARWTLVIFRRTRKFGSLATYVRPNRSTILLFTYTAMFETVWSATVNRFVFVSSEPRIRENSRLKRTNMRNRFDDHSGNWKRLISTRICENWWENFPRKIFIF